MTLAFSTLGASGATLPEIVAIAQRHGCRGVELRSAPDEAVHADLGAAERAAMRDGFARAGIAVIAIDSYVGLATPSGRAGSDDQLDDLIAQIELAASIGAPAVRVFMRDESEPSALGPSDGERIAIGRIAAVRELCDRLGVAVLAETHDTHCLGRRLAGFMTGLDEQLPVHPCGVVWDTVHSWSHGEAPAETLRLLSPWLAHLHIGDVRSSADPEPVMPGEGGYPIDQLADALSEASWNGWASLEWERKWYPQLAPLDAALAAARTWAAKVIE